MPISPLHDRGEVVKDDGIGWIVLISFSWPLDVTRHDRIFDIRAGQPIYSHIISLARLTDPTTTPIEKFVQT